MPVNIALNIRKLRHWRELKQSYVADQSGISKRKYSDIETGKRSPTLAELDCIAAALQLTVFHLLLFDAETMAFNAISPAPRTTQLPPST
ncbi:MAG: helix-turn-helix transcriptional regulator [Bacteroidetes bacterium]|nr:helix-turn-helix transcriptional regulator [Bacteroidota bacterium]